MVLPEPGLFVLKPNLPPKRLRNRGGRAGRAGNDAAGAQSEEIVLDT
jgi:hypothetical protein